MNVNRESGHLDWNTLSLSDARTLAANDGSNWCIVPLGTDLTVARLVVGDEVRVLRVRDHTGALLRFPTIEDARLFVRRELGIQRTALFPL